jgi:hypothetical protein
MPEAGDCLRLGWENLIDDIARRSQVAAGRANRLRLGRMGVAAGKLRGDGDPDRAAGRGSA